MLIDPVDVQRRRPPQRRRGFLIAAIAVGVTAIVVAALIVVVLAHRTTTAPSVSPIPGAQRMPTGDLPADADAPNGWKQVFSDDFTGPDATAATDGSLNGKWWGYGAGTPITNSSNGVYDSSKVVSVSDGALHFDLHSEGGTAYGAVASPAGLPAQTYGRYSVRYRYEPGTNVAGFKSVWMLWPDSGHWGDGEIDFNEFDNEADRTTMRSALLQACGIDTGCPQVVRTVRLDPTVWHTGTVVWAPGVVRAYVDGHLVAQSTDRVPDKPMHLLLQTEASDYGPQAEPGARLGIDVDWVSVWTRA